MAYTYQGACLLSIDKSVSRIQRSVPVLSSPLLLKSTAQGSSPTSSTPPCHQNAPHNSLTQASMHFSIPYSLCISLLLQLCLTPASRHPSALITPDLFLSQLFSFHPGILVDFELIAKQALLNESSLLPLICCGHVTPKGCGVAGGMTVREQTTSEMRSFLKCLWD